MYGVWAVFWLRCSAGSLCSQERTVSIPILTLPSTRLTLYTDHHQLTLILDVLGTPTMEDYYGIKSRRAREYIRSLPFKKKIPWKAMFPKTNDLALDLLERLLAFNPVKRITVEEALKHPYLEPYHDPEDEPTADPIPEEFFDFDKNKDNLTKEQLKRTLLSTEI
jgi:mitogen-activated protein kinase 1/3